MGKYGRFTGGTHFKYLKKKVKIKKSIEPRATIEQLIELKELGLNFQKDSISQSKAKELIQRLKGEVKHKQT